MDRFLYISMSGAKETLRAQTSNNHNLANASTTGFRANLDAFQSRAVAGSGYASRVYATDATIGWDQSQGALQSTGRDLDVGIQGEGWIAVQGTDGREAYTRAGDLRIDPNGLLMNGAGHYVLGDAGPLAVPPHSSVMIGADGTVSIVPIGQGPETTATVGRIKLVNPDPKVLEKRSDGLVRAVGGSVTEADAGVQLLSGALETSNVGIAETMVSMIEYARQFEVAVRMMRVADENASRAASLASMS